MLSKIWHTKLFDALKIAQGPAAGQKLSQSFEDAFPVGYQENFSIENAVSDMAFCEKLSVEHKLEMDLYQCHDEIDTMVHFKLLSLGFSVMLSDIVPILENMGLRIMNEKSYEIKPKDREVILLNDYRMIYKKDMSFSLEEVKRNFQDAFKNILAKETENDGFNQLVLYANLSGREVMILRAYAKYLWQTGFNFSPNRNQRDFDCEAKRAIIEKNLELIENVNEDRVIRRYLQVILATIRTNYYQVDAQGAPKNYFSFKLKSSDVPELPLPVPLYEIFVYAACMEGIHLRAAKVSRGGIRWSDRREDFRTEILSLMKTQQVKNAVIVPMGAKGGFVLKQMSDKTTPEALRKEVIECYKILIRGLLDLTDNYQGNRLVHPLHVVRYDENDPYLVVAADKGTATFSDTANAIAEEYGFWLSDAFASGGKTGYDHKKLAITARGAWESVKSHFQVLGVDLHKQIITMIGIGDMSGDVFGNGLLLSKSFKLIAAFNHKEIFIDPNPDPLKSYEERKRLFEMPYSNWSDYNPKLISKGGGVFSRSTKMIDLSQEMRQAFNTQKEKLAIDELIRIILKAPVDLLWNGGIGTYVKSSSESQHAVNDKTNDMVRINGNDLGSKVVAEGGNLGFTQLGRIEYAQRGGFINTDAIDNSGGVHCSDHEVNIKILLNEVVKQGRLSEEERNQILASIQEEVAELVLSNNKVQTQAISMEAFRASENLDMHGYVIQELEQSQILDRSLEFLPTQEAMDARKLINQGLTRPELAVVMAYSKMSLKQAILASSVPEDPYFQGTLENAFPKPLRIPFKEYMSNHRLKREIIATQLSSHLINNMGISFVTRLKDETGSNAADILRAYMVSSELFNAELIQKTIDDLEDSVPIAIRYQMLHELNRLLRRSTRWFLRKKNRNSDIRQTIDRFALKIDLIGKALPNLISDFDVETQPAIRYYTEAHVPVELATHIVSFNSMFSALDIVEGATLKHFPVDQMAMIYYEIGKRLELGWLRERIKKQSVNNHWEALARASFMDDLDRQQRSLAMRIMRQALTDSPMHVWIDHWLAQHKIVLARWEHFRSELKRTVSIDFTMLAVTLRALLDMTPTKN
jgi:glutamate dehydrogenase